MFFGPKSTADSLAPKNDLYLFLKVVLKKYEKNIFDKFSRKNCSNNPEFRGHFEQILTKIKILKFFVN